MATTFQALRIHAYGGPEVLKLETLEIPEPKAGEVLVKLQFAGVNPIDWKPLINSGVIFKEESL